MLECSCSLGIPFQSVSLVSPDQTLPEELWCEVMMLNASGAQPVRCQIFTERHLNPIHISPFFSLQEGRAAVSQILNKGTQLRVLVKLDIEIRASAPNTEQNSAFVDTFVCYADSKWVF